MSWELLAPLITRHGVEFAYKLWALAQSKADPTNDDWQELRRLSSKHYDDYIIEATRRLNATPGVTSNPNP